MDGQWGVTITWPGPEGSELKQRKFVISDSLVQVSLFRPFPSPPGVAKDVTDQVTVLRIAEGEVWRVA
jgi:hypothetical protein